MQPLTTSAEVRAARDEIYARIEEIKKKEREVYAEKKRLADQAKRLTQKDKDLNPYARLGMTLTAQFFGLVLLLTLTFLIFPSGQDNIAAISAGFNFIRNIAWYYLILSLAIPLLAIVAICYRKQFGHGYVDFILLAYVAIDIFLLILLVYQQGGLCRSMFMPVFFLIPTAYLIAERRDSRYRWRRLLILTVIAVCVYGTYHVAVNLWPSIENGMLKPGAGPVRFLWWSIPVTDFFALAHPYYDKAVFYASLTATSVPIIQILIGWMLDRLNNEENGKIILRTDPK